MLNSAKAGPIAKRVAEDITATIVQAGLDRASPGGSDLVVLAATALHDDVVQVGGLLGVDHDIVAGTAMEGRFAAANFDAFGLHHGATADPETRDGAKLNGGHLGRSSLVQWTCFDLRACKSRPRL
jgi:hypothetical protein